MGKNSVAMNGITTFKEVSESRRLKWAGHVIRMVERSAYRVLVGKYEKRRPHRRPKCR